MLILADDLERKIMSRSQLIEKLKGFEWGELVPIKFEKGELVGGDLLPSFDEVMKDKKHNIRIEISARYDLEAINTATKEIVVYRRWKDGLSEKVMNRTLDKIANGKITVRNLTDTTKAIGRDVIDYIEK